MPRQKYPPLSIEKQAEAKAYYRLTGCSAKTLAQLFGIGEAKAGKLIDDYLKEYAEKQLANLRI